MTTIAATLTITPAAGLIFAPAIVAGHAGPAVPLV